MQELELISEILSSAKMFVETNGRVFSHKLLWDVLPFLKSVPKNDTQKNDKDKNNISVAGTEWDEIGILSDLFDSNVNSNGNSSSNSEQTIDETSDRIGVEPIIDANALINNDIDEDDEDTDSIHRTDNVTIGLTGYCSRNVTIRKLPLVMRYKGDCHNYASDLLQKKELRKHKVECI